ncbi:MAG: hypothetical protein IJ174_06065, partial [Clostridia bacterium]|nr:hypothetical protein [Clostridia bacterium]
SHPEEALAVYRARDILKGRQVTVKRGSETFAGTSLGVDSDFSLLVSREDRIERLTSGEVIHVSMEEDDARGTV